MDREKILFSDIHRAYKINNTWLGCNNGVMVAKSKSLEREQKRLARFSNVLNLTKSLS